MKSVRITTAVLAIIILLLSVSEGKAIEISFADNFTSVASPSWQNQNGQWTVNGGNYDATYPTNGPNYSYTSLGYELTDFSIEVDIRQFDDGGIWLRSHWYGEQNISGVLLVTGGFQHEGTGLYWHTVLGDWTSPEQNSVSGLVLTETDVHLKVVVSGNTYTAYLYNMNESLLGSTSFSTDLFPIGQVGLYDYSTVQSFDNFSLNGSAVPLPSGLILLGSGLLGLVGLRKKLFG